MNTDNQDDSLTLEALYSEGWTEPLGSSCSARTNRTFENAVSNVTVGVVSILAKVMWRVMGLCK